MSLEKNTLEFLKSIVSSHATFNALSAIQNYIVSDEKRSALISLSGFAKFIRKMSATAVSSRIPMNEDLAFVESYLEMELLRFGDDIKFDIQISDEARNASEEIPSFILQPTIEKMLLKGLKSGSRDFELKVKVDVDEDNLIAIIALDKALKEEIELEFSPEQANRIELLTERLGYMGDDVTVNEGNVNSSYCSTIKIPLK